MYPFQDGEAVADSGLERKRLRLAPDAAPKGWCPIVGELVEVNEDDCWWEATVQSKSGKSLSVMYRVSDEVRHLSVICNSHR